jgi:hypothetical protein
MSRGRSIRLFLADGSPGGIITAEIMNWTGHVMVAPRSRLADLVQRPEAGRTGIYILSGTDPDGGLKPLVYVGETDNVGKRLAQHNKDDAKEFWEQTCTITSKDQNLTKAHVRYLESRLIAIAGGAGRAKLVNGTAPEYGLLPEGDLADMDYFVEQLRIVLPVLGMDFLKETGAASIDSAQPQPAATPPAPTTAAAIDTDRTRTPTTMYRPTNGGVDSPVFEIRDVKAGLVANAVEMNGEMVVLKGSQARKEEGESLTQTLRMRRRDLVVAGVLQDDPANPKLYRFTANAEFNSPSQSSSLVFARSDNGRWSWKIKGENKTYAAWQQEQVEAATPTESET